MSDKRRKGSGRAEFRPFVLLHAAALAAVQQAKSTPHLRLENCLHALVDSAFSLEAYLNHVGPELLTFWPSLDRIGPLEKLDVVTKHLDLSPDFGRRPFQSVTVAFTTRNLAAHARTEVISFERRLTRNKEGFPIRPLSRLEKLCTMQVVNHVVVDIAEVINRIHLKSPQAAEALWFTGEIEWSATYEGPVQQ